MKEVRVRRLINASSVEALKIPSFAKFFTGQVISNTGSWFQNLAVSLITVTVTGSATALAVVTAAQFGPTFLFGGLAGRLADSVSPKKIIIVTSVVSASASSAIAVVIAQPTIQLPLVYLLMAVNGTCFAFDRIAGQAFVYEMVGPEKLQNGVVLNSMVISAGRSLGPALAGFALLFWGPVSCLLVNAASFLIAGGIYLFIPRRNLFVRQSTTSGSAKVSTIQTLRRVFRSRDMSVLLTVNFLVTMVAFSLNIVITTIVLLTFEGDTATLGLAHASNAVGALIAGLLLAGAKKLRVSSLIGACLLVSFAYYVNAASPTLLFFMLAAPLLGFAVGYFQAVIFAAAQNSTEPHEIGRTMSFVSMSQTGILPLGALWVGFIVDLTSAEMSLTIAASVALLCAAFVYLVVVRPDRRRTRLS